MENAITPAQSIECCSACYSAIADDDFYCNSCGYPLKGSETEQKHFMSVRSSKEIDLEEANKKIARAGYILYIIAGATLVMGFDMYATSKEKGLNLMLVNVILAAIYAGLGVWSKKKPLTAIISGFALYALIFLLNAIVSPITILAGILGKIFFVACFIKGIKSAIEAERLKKELNIE